LQLDFKSLKKRQLLNEQKICRDILNKDFSNIKEVNMEVEISNSSVILGLAEELRKKGVEKIILKSNIAKIIIIRVDERKFSAKDIANKLISKMKNVKGGGNKKIAQIRIL